MDGIQLQCLNSPHSIILTSSMNPETGVTTGIEFLIWEKSGLWELNHT